MNSFMLGVKALFDGFATIGQGYVIDKTTFRYMGKTGIHHKFIEAHIGWSRTFTDAQLIGKKIEEAGARASSLKASGST